MGRIACVHGIGKQVAGEQSLLRDWTHALLDGLTRASHGGAITADDVVMGFYGHLFRPPGERLAVGDPMFTADDVEPGLEPLRLADLVPRSTGTDDLEKQIVTWRRSRTPQVLCRAQPPRPAPLLLQTWL
ncbi:hypothetical protein AB0M83_17640 [Amycolatopsis sp. NPDC051106]|uniref:hypothetical protein n=1 Tax=unclassified Amycolatopsis TaxID=2618356 RepID=UPI003444A3E6